MFDTRRTRRAQAAQRVTEDAWDRLVAAAESARDAARTMQRRTHDMADGAGSSVHSATSSVLSATDEARRRAGAAVDALAGRQQRRHWEWIAGAVVVGLVVGWVAAAGARRATAETPTEMPERAVEEEDPLDAVGIQRR